MRKTIYLSRHGQTIFNLEGRTQGATDSPLTPLGIEQAQKARAYFIKLVDLVNDTLRYEILER